MPTLDKYHPEPCLSLPEEAWCRIEHTLRLDKPDVGLRCRIARYVDIHFLGLTAKSPVRANDLRKQLERLRGDAAQLHSNFEISDDSSDAEWAQFYALQLTQDGLDREALKLRLSELIESVDEVLRLVRRETRPKDDRYENLILALAHTYRNVTNKKPTVSYNPGADPDHPYRGKFFEFVVAVLDAIGDKYAQPHNNKALGGKVVRTLKTWRRTVGA